MAIETSTRDLVRGALLEHWQRLYGYALSQTRDRDRAADVLQQAALQGLAARDPPVDARALRAWLFRIVRNVAVDTHRREAVRHQEEACEAEPAIWSYDDRVIAGVTVSQGLERIADTHREIIDLVDLHGFRYAEAAEILGIAEGTVMSRLSRARKALLDAINGNVVVIEQSRRRHS
ncbi:MAG: RNA polymerase sigma factor [Hyphomicrobium aestuarii]|nr:RNA polymerase sigma factor [Hyphomicrobium aestuarii]